MFLCKVWGLGKHIPVMLSSILAYCGQMLEQCQIISALEFCSSFKLFNLLKPLPFPCGRMANKEPWATGLQSQPHIAADMAHLQYFSHSQSLRLNAPLQRAKNTGLTRLRFYKNWQRWYCKALFLSFCYSSDILNPRYGTEILFNVN